MVDTENSKNCIQESQPKVERVNINSHCRRRIKLLTKTTFHWLTSILSSFNADNIVVSGIVITPLVVLNCPYLWLAAKSYDSHVSFDRKKAAHPNIWVDVCMCKFPLHCRSINCYVENQTLFYKCCSIYVLNLGSNYRNHKIHNNSRYKNVIFSVIIFIMACEI